MKNRFQLGQHVTYKNKRWAVFAINEDANGKIILTLKRGQYREKAPAEEVTE